MKKRILAFAARMMLPALVGLMGGYLAGGMLHAEAVPLANGDFETGDLTGWTPFTTANGTLGPDMPQVVMFDMNGTPSYAAKFQVGQVEYTPDAYEGGGIYQNVDLPAGQYEITGSAEIASSFEGPGVRNDEAGRFELLVDGTVVATHVFGPIAANETKRSTLMATVSVDVGGYHEIRFRITRPYLPSPFQYIDSVYLAQVASTSDVSPTSDGGDHPGNKCGEKHDKNSAKHGTMKNNGKSQDGC